MMDDDGRRHASKRHGLLKILLRVCNVPTLFRCATTCKAWRRLIANPFFLGRRWPENTRHTSSRLGVVLGGQGGKNDGNDGVPTFVPASRSALEQDRRFLGSFVHAPAGLLDHVTPLTSRCGLLLVRLARPSPSRPGHERGLAYVAACNLLTRTCHVLLPIKYRLLLYMRCCTIATGEDCCSGEQDRAVPSPKHSAFFKVLIICDVGANYDLHVFSSAHGTDWSALGNCFNHHPEHRMLLHVGQCHAAVSRGMARWLFQEDMSDYYTLDVSLETGHAALTKLGMVDRSLYLYMPPRLGIATDGELSFVCLYHRRFLLEWPKYNLIDTGHFFCLAGEMSGTLHIVDCHRRVYMTVLETRAIQEVTDQFCGLNCLTMVPPEIEWPAFFMSRLGGR
ncbi:hypothetical protein BRADI_1g56623v3 [Brachypodium distachyon]|uniref:F-box domain-containing protein n=1 Tax=Brachypodium distachyon TaxID=15368 RepID=A0A0Q3HD50_BRADI|nr:hypothetical protein BRADI_1g56623v3 [Brachypodium distachyon]